MKEIHGYRPELGFRVFTEAALAAAVAQELRVEAALAPPVRAA